MNVVSGLKSFFLKNRIEAIVSFLAASIFLLIAYSEGLHEELFLIDDYSLITIPQIRSPFDLELIKTLFTPKTHIDFYPFRDLTYWADFHLFGASLSGVDGMIFRLQNFFWLAISSIMISFILKELKISYRASILFGIIWLLHPLHSEMIMWPSARKDCLAIALGLSSSYFYLRHLQEEKQKVWGMLAIFSFCLSLLSKATFTLLPVIIPLISFLCKDRSAWKKRNMMIWFPALILAITSGICQTYIYAGSTDMRFDYTHIYRIKGVLASFGRYFAGLFFPSQNAVDVENWGNWVNLNSNFIPYGACIFLIIVIFTLWAIFKRNKTNIWVLFAFWLCYLPVSSFLFPHRNFYSVRYFEAPFIPLFIGSIIILYQTSFYQYILKSKLLSRSIILITLTFLGYSSLKESENWLDNVRPFSKALTISKDSPSLLNFLKNAMINKKNWGQLSHDDLRYLNSIENKLKKICDSKININNFREANLCNDYWAYFTIESNNYVFNPKFENLLVQGFQEVNLKASERMKIRTNWLRALRENLGMRIGLPWGQLFSHDNAVTVSRRLDVWQERCLTGDTFRAKSLLYDWYFRHLIDQDSLIQSVLDLKKYSPSIYLRAKACLIPMQSFLYRKKNLSKINKKSTKVLLTE